MLLLVQIGQELLMAVAQRCANREEGFSLVLYKIVAESTVAEAVAKQFCHGRVAYSRARVPL